MVQVVKFFGGGTAAHAPCPTLPTQSKEPAGTLLLDRALSVWKTETESLSEQTPTMLEPMLTKSTMLFSYQERSYGPELSTVREELSKSTLQRLVFVLRLHIIDGLTKQRHRGAECVNFLPRLRVQRQQPRLRVSAFGLHSN